jgi:Holliday junction DNA helicase RuvA
MIASLRGTVVERDGAGTVVIEVAGVGWVVHVTPATLAELEPTSPAFLYVHHHIREGAQSLYGFAAREERRAFEVLLAAHGIGPSLALAVLACHSPSALADIVASDDVTALTSVSGIGRKTAERMLIELKGRLIDAGIGERQVGGRPSADVREALAGLGYSQDEIRDVLREVGDVASAEAALRAALTLLGARRA